MNKPLFVKQDYKVLLETPRGTRSGFRPLHWWVLGIAAAGGMLLFSSSPEEASARRADSLALALPGTGGEALETQAAQRLTRLPLPPAETSRPGPQDRPATTTETPPTAATAEPGEAARQPLTAATPSSPPPGRWHEARVKPGDSLARIFARLDLSPRELHAVMSLGKNVAALKRIHPGQKLQFRVDDQGRLLELKFEKDRLHALQVLRDAEGFSSREIARSPEHVTAHASATIDSSLFLAAQKAGLSDNLTMELAGIFGWDIDFALDIRAGDRFTVLYEELYLDGEKIGNGAILAAEFVNQGRVYRALRYTDTRGHSDYYTPQGKSMRKAFLRTPVAFSRISSRFSLGRKHPILNRIRAHKGVDYAAPYGTPVKATGDGKIVFRGAKGGYGKTVVLQHGSRYSTLYAHLSRFARSLKPGSRVRQGQVIGYVGQSGLATGPHLHYEFRVNGTHRNPLTVKLPAAAPIESRYRADFENHSRSLLAQLELVRERETQVALNRN
ncbi:peptidoglycan DD-metalloendopeptidase family protein [Thiohalobacter sp. IOR34]|uniref:peptidoglycan DD-metalloendopeptidase family protein n=1 Tax=Thiohalobacter sp. IOR34 TaxID=3057176 RepID=UPI0025B2358B|nr:peptidoglycan DD-metalloendopeptidase family protein [Thiohalobacter sp. IOR34]WJW75130.1 peptidoglycan DD-metalloendopeptidase family protein [Thiohalobacter sp. IOR34]